MNERKTYELLRKYYTDTSESLKVIKTKYEGTDTMIMDTYRK